MSCRKQTLTLGVVSPTVNKTPQEADGVEVALADKAAAVVQTVAEIVKLLNIYLKGKMKDCCLSKLTITYGSNRAT